MFVEGIGETLYMTGVSTLMAYVIGLPLGVILHITDSEGIRPNRWINTILGAVVNIIRSIPFVILIIAVIPVTMAIVHTTLGATATIVPLVIGAAPFVARMVESSLKEVDAGVVEAAEAMGASPFQIVWKVLLPEARPSLMVGSVIAITTILGYSAMAGVVGGGGLGVIAIQYGYNRYRYDIMMITVALLVVIVQVFQEVGMRLAKRGDKRISK
ncbi:MAG: methionine ABC transporter permease [Clostridiales bacterium]|nr:MAG: methionine ABC transporter permease [Clostridiales bacterium]